MNKSSKSAGMARDSAPRPFERRVLREGIRDQLMKDILSGRLAPGDRIVETRIAQQFGVSQAPVREALRDLELFGFILSSPFRGAIVREYSLQDLVQIYPIRAVLEGLAARNAATRISGASLRRLDAAIVTMRSSVLRRDIRTAVDADIAFHLTIVENSGNPLIKEFWQRMRLATTIYLTVLSQPYDSLQRLGERHMPMLEALRAGDGDLAERVTREHIAEPLLQLEAQAADAPILPHKTRRKHDGSRRRTAAARPVPPVTPSR
jgi:DNA-binding GntR family transcriptional regulator